MSSKRQTTFAKMTRERAVQEKRERKREKKRAAAEAKALAASGEAPVGNEIESSEPDEGGGSAQA